MRVNPRTKLGTKETLHEHELYNVITSITTCDHLSLHSMHRLHIINYNQYKQSSEWVKIRKCHVKNGTNLSTGVNKTATSAILMILRNGVMFYLKSNNISFTNNRF